MSSLVWSSPRARGDSGGERGREAGCADPSSPSGQRALAGLSASGGGGRGRGEGERGRGEGRGDGEVWRGKETEEEGERVGYIIAYKGSIICVFPYLSVRLTGITE